MDAINEETMGQYFALLKEVLDEYNLATHPEWIYHVDESGMLLDSKTLNIVTKTGTKKVRYSRDARLTDMTVKSRYLITTII